MTPHSTPFGIPTPQGRACGHAYPQVYKFGDHHVTETWASVSRTVPAGLLVLQLREDPDQLLQNSSP